MQNLMVNQTLAPHLGLSNRKLAVVSCNNIIRPVPSTYDQKLSPFRHAVSKTKAESEAGSASRPIPHKYSWISMTVCFSFNVYLSVSGIGTTKTLLWSQVAQNERLTMIQQEVKRTEENRRQDKAVKMGAQGAWTTWDTIYVDRKLTWEDIWKYEPLRLFFLPR